ncbi:MAG: hypothetical protein JWN21_2404 [Sphingomonas bacterium]|uniref:hypothetical protein n=1 Tax=Sphingomonas bacterium TaxID=1895847 RepID=UPI0026127FA2|nr:hypothetical protein [Sphingomonas bacterium]MDB5696861.1 hypothetical protein [Sphingomonas bacterium]
MLVALLLAILNDDGRDVGRGWTLFKNEDDCALVRSYEGDTLLRVAYTDGLNDGYVTIADPAFKSIEQGKEYKLKLIFVNGKRLDDGWGEVTGHGFRKDDLTGVSFKLSGDTLLNDIASNALLGIFRDDVVVASLRLDGSAAATTELKACAREVQRENPADPFAK